MGQSRLEIAFARTQIGVESGVRKGQVKDVPLSMKDIYKDTIRIVKEVVTQAGASRLSQR